MGRAGTIGLLGLVTALGLFGIVRADAVMAPAMPVVADGAAWQAALTGSGAVPAQPAPAGALTFSAVAPTPPAAVGTPPPMTAAAPAGSAGTPVAAPAASQPAGPFGNIEIRRSHALDPAAAAPGKEGEGSLGSGYDASRVALALGLVIAMIFGLKWAGRRFFALPSAPGASRAVQVLGRTALSPRQQLLLIKVGRRVIVASDSGGAMTSLAEIVDPDEIAVLVGQIQGERAASRLPVSAFGSLFGRSKRQFEEAADAGLADDGSGSDRFAAREGRPFGRDPGDFDVEAGGLDSDAAEPERVETEDDAAAERTVSTAREEITGLMEKVRLVSKRFGEP